MISQRFSSCFFYLSISYEVNWSLKMLVWCYNVCILSKIFSYSIVLLFHYAVKLMKQISKFLSRDVKQRNREIFNRGIFLLSCEPKIIKRKFWNFTVSHIKSASNFFLLIFFGKFLISLFCFAWKVMHNDDMHIMTITLFFFTVKFKKTSGKRLFSKISKNSK